jgi:pimeloyl-ACP methyl ester carboxylesterase
LPVLERDGLSLHYEEFGEGFPLLLFAPGGMHSMMQFWSRPGAAGEKLPWIDPTADLSDSFRVIAVDQRNTGSSRALSVRLTRGAPMFPMPSPSSITSGSN